MFIDSLSCKNKYQTLFISTQKLFRLKPNGILEGFGKKSTPKKKKEYKDDIFFYLVLFLFSPNLTILVSNDSLSNHTLSHNPKELRNSEQTLKPKG